MWFESQNNDEVILFPLNRKVDFRQILLWIKNDVFNKGDILFYNGPKNLNTERG